jgi:hypothetical protein
VATAARRIVGLALLLLTLVPLYRMLDHPRTGQAGSVTAAALDVYTEFLWSGLLLILPVAILASLWPGDMVAVLRRLLRAATDMSEMRYAALLGLLAAALTFAFTVAVLGAKPNQIDSLAQMLQARFWAAGQLAGPADDEAAFWSIQNALFTARGWVSQYPPGHTVLLALATRAGAPAALGAGLTGVAVFFAVRIAALLFPRDPIMARAAPALLAVSPFFVFLGGSFMNHVTVAAFVAVGTWCLASAWLGRPGFAWIAGLAFAWAFATRPLSTMAMAVGIACTVPFLAGTPPTLRRGAAIHARALLGAAPVLIAMCVYNAWFFGAPLRMGYSAALGPAMGLGFHIDPWGNMYGLREAIAYTSADLIALSVHLLETPLPSVALVGCFLLVARRLEPGARVLVAWALLPVAANVFYWHHGMFMGPRMLHEAAPAWAMLFAVAAIGLARMLPHTTGLAGRLRPRNALIGSVVVSTVVGAIFLAPQRGLSYDTRTAYLAAPEFDEPALVFVHGSWAGRVAMTLAAGGIRLDHVETLLRQNSTCDLDRLAGFVARGNTDAVHAGLQRLDTTPRPDRLPPRITIAAGSFVRMWPGETLTAECARQAHSDRLGVMDVTPLLWQGDLPGAPPRGARYVRDLGPERNAALIRRHPDRTPWVYGPFDNGTPAMLPYAEGMARLWDAS